jgi:tRNA uridine 5-carboxymethylaminomethyl modification enzyme
LKADTDIVVVGGGHAGVEAALAAARMGMDVVVVTMHMDDIGHMPCNPSIGGVGKSQLVREVDALGGEMGLAIDETGIQFRRLNTRKGPAVQGLRAQADKAGYKQRMRRALETEDRVTVVEAEAVGCEIADGVIGAVITTQGRIGCRACILAIGTFLRGKLHRGLHSWSGAREGSSPARELAEWLRNSGLEMGRLKTGTPARLKRSSLDFSALTEQPGDPQPEAFSFRTEKIERHQIPCHMTWTNRRTHDIIRRNLDRSPLFSGRIEGIGPRYCPSIEDKVVRFPDRDRHQVFLEPETQEGESIYASGISTSLPDDVQVDFIRSIVGLEKAEPLVLGYAVEYDFVVPTELEMWLEARTIPGLFLAGQINGTSGYEEAAAQGMMAGINAVLKLRGRDPVVLNRSEAYIGVLIDDLVTKGTEEPYRMFTSRAEHRMSMRLDNADERLMHYGRQFGLITAEEYENSRSRWKLVRKEIQLLKQVRMPAAEADAFLAARGENPKNDSPTLAELLKRPGVEYRDLAEADASVSEIAQDVAERVQIEIKYEGYITREKRKAEQSSRLEAMVIPEDVDYGCVEGISTEAREKLGRVQPRTLGQASRISGVSPADISVLMVFIERRRRDLVGDSQSGNSRGPEVDGDRSRRGKTGSIIRAMRTR